MAVSEVIKSGQVQTGNRVDYIQPEAWQEKIFRILPNGKAPITAIAQRMNRDSVASQDYNWWEQAFQAMRGDVTDVYTNASLASAYASGGVAGTPLYLGMTAAHARQLVAGQLLLLITGTTSTFRHVRVDDVSVGSDTTSYAAVTLLETDTSNRLAESSITFRVSGSAYAEGSGLPDVTFREPTKFSNQTQISMEAIQLTGSALTELERVKPDKYKRTLEDALQRLRVQQERNMLFGLYYSGWEDGLEVRHTRGLYTAISENESTHILNYVTDSDSDYAGKTWLNAGWDWLKNKVLLELARWTDDSGNDGTRLFLCGDQAHLAIADLVEDMGMRMVTETTNKWGIPKVSRIEGLEIDLDIAIHPLLREDPAFRRAGIIYDPRWVEYVYKKDRDLTFVPRGKNVNGFTWRDGIKEGWFAEWGTRYHNLQGMAWVDGLGSTNTQ